MGIEAVLDQLKIKAMKMGFEFNIMVVGELLPQSPASLWSPALYLQGFFLLYLDQAPPRTLYRESGGMAAEVVPGSVPPSLPYS